MKKKYLLLLVLGFAVVACDGNNPISSTNSSTLTSDSNANSTSGSVSSSSSSGSTTSAVYQRFKEIYDSLEMNYTAFDEFYSYTPSYNELGIDEGGSYNPISNQMVVTENSMFNFGLHEGIAKYKHDDVVDFYSYGVHLYTQDEETVEGEFIPSYKPMKSFEYYGLGLIMDDTGMIEPNEATYRYLYRLPTTRELTTILKSTQRIRDLEEIFTVGEDDGGNYTLTTTHPYIGMLMFDYNIFDRCNGYTREFYQYNLLQSLQDYMKETITTKITIVEGSFPELVWDVYLDNFGPEPTLAPLLRRELIPLKGLSNATLTRRAFLTFVPDEFYTNGPGAEPANVQAIRSKFKADVEALRDAENYTFLLDYPETATSRIMISSRYISTDMMEYQVEGIYNLGYYNVPLNGEKNNIKERAIYVYDPDGTEGEKEHAYIDLATAFTIFQNSYGRTNVTLNPNKYEATIRTDNGSAVVNLDEFIDGIWYESMFYGINMFDNTLTESNGTTESNYWLARTGGGWEDGIYISARSEEIYISNYYIISALTRGNQFLSNFPETLTLNFYPDVENPEGMYLGDVSYFGLATDGNYYTFNVGTATFTDVGTTKATKEIGDYVNEKYSLNVPVAEEVPADD